MRPLPRLIEFRQTKHLLRFVAASTRDFAVPLKFRAIGCGFSLPAKPALGSPQKLKNNNANMIALQYH